MRIRGASSVCTLTCMAVLCMLSFFARLELPWSSLRCRSAFCGGHVCIMPDYNLFYNSPYVCLSVAVSKPQVAFMSRSSREMSQTVRIA